MRFDRRQNSSPAPYFNRRDQKRMLKLVALLALILVCTQFAADPATWKWMFPAESATKKNTNPNTETTSPTRKTSDGFVSENEPNRSPAIAESSANRQPSQTTPASENLPESIEQDLQEKVNDGSVGVRSAESDVFFAVIAHAKAVDLPKLKAAADEDLSYIALTSDSEAFRGRLVHLRGTLRRLERREAIPNAAHVEEFWEGWLFTPDSGLFPYRIIAASVPASLPQGMELEVPVEFTGYFFKREGYESNDGLKEAPTLIGHSIRPLPIRSRKNDILQDDGGLIPYVVGLALIIAAGLGCMMWRFRVSDRQFNNRHVRTFTAATPEAIDSLQNLETIETGEALRRLAEESRLAEEENEHSST